MPEETSESLCGVLEERVLEVVLLSVPGKYSCTR